MTDARLDARRQMVDRLVGNADFIQFVGMALDEFCAWDQGYGQVDDFHQGVRAAGSWMVREIALTANGRDAIAGLYRKSMENKNHQQGE